MLKQTASISVTHLGIFWLFNPQHTQIATIFALIRAGTSDCGLQRCYKNWQLMLSPFSHWLCWSSLQQCCATAQPVIVKQQLVMNRMNVLVSKSTHVCGFLKQLMVQLTSSRESRILSAEYDHHMLLIA